MDLFGSTPLQGPQFSSSISVAVTSSQEARLLIRQALQKSRNACINPSGQLLELAPNRSHMCIRIRIKYHQRMSQVWLIDTVGSRPLAGARNSTRHFTSSPDVDREQRVLSQQLFGLNKLLSEMSSVAHGARTLESARSSNLSFFVSSLVTDNHSLVCIATVHPEASHHLDTYNTLRICSAARTITVPCKHTASNEEFLAIPAAQYLLHATASKPVSSRSPHPLPSVKNASLRAPGAPSTPLPQANAFGLSTSPTHVIEVGSQVHTRFKNWAEADAFEMSDGSSAVLSPLSSDAGDKSDGRLHHQVQAEQQQAASINHARQQLHRAAQPPAYSDDESHAPATRAHHAISQQHNDDDGTSEGDQSDDGVFYASKIVDAAAGSGQVGGWSTFLEENMSSSAASEDNASASDTGGDAIHDSSSLKLAFHDTLAKVSSPSTGNAPAFAINNRAEESPSNFPEQPVSSASSAAGGDRFSQQQPLARTSAARHSFPPSVPAASSISLIPVAASPQLAPASVSDSVESPDALQEVAQAKKVFQLCYLRSFFSYFRRCRLSHHLLLLLPCTPPFHLQFLLLFPTNLSMRIRLPCLSLPRHRSPRNSSCATTTRYFPCSDRVKIKCVHRQFPTRAALFLICFFAGLRPPRTTSSLRAGAVRNTSASGTGNGGCQARGAGS